jgi:hypothetical protein
MLARPIGNTWAYEPKWDGFRAIVSTVDGLLPNVRLMQVPRGADEEGMTTTPPNDPTADEPQELRPEVRELILSFDAKDRRDPDVVRSNGGSKKKRRRGERPSPAK